MLFFIFNSNVVIKTIEGNQVILFLDDWKDPKYSNVVVHYETRNRSFLELAQKLKNIGVKNHLFFLQLHDERLRHIDPFDPNLSMEMMAWVAIECRRNFFYAAREIFKAPATAGLSPNQITANRANVALWWLFFNHVTVLLTQPRQTGKSFNTDILMSALFNFMCSNTQINLLTKDDTLRAANIKRLKDIYDELPSYLNFKTKDDANNTETITIKRWNNTYLTHVPQSSPKGAYKVGRGLTSPIFQIDEPPFQPNIDIAMGSALGAMGAACEEAEESGEPYGVILTTTAGKKDEASGKYIYTNYVEGSALWTERFYDAKNILELREMIKRNSRKGAIQVYASFTHRQLGKTDEWLKEQLFRTNQSPDDANRDYFNRWTSGTATSPLPTHILERLTKMIVPERHVQVYPVGGYMLRWYIDEHAIPNYLATRRVCIGIDTSDASGGDDISLIGTDIETGGTVFAGTYNETNLIMFAQFLVFLLKEMKNSTMIIERRSSAVTIIDYLLMFLPQQNIDPFERLFNWVVNDPLEHKTLFEEVKLPLRRRRDDLYVRAKTYFGFATSGSGQTSRTELYSTTLQHACKRCTDVMRDRALTEQITGLINKNGRIDHPEGGHDDLVIGMLLNHWLLTMAKNLSFYGIDPRDILIEQKVMKEVKPDKAYFINEQIKIRNDIEKIYEQMSKESDEYVLQRLEKQLRFLDSRIVLEDGEHFSVDALIHELRQKKKQNRFLR